MYSLRSNKSNVPILILEIDIKAAYRRYTKHSDLSCTSITNLDNYVIVILRELFGRAICPFSFTDIVSESVTYLENDLLAHIDWDEQLLYLLHAHSLDLPLIFNKSVSFRPTLLVDVVVPPSLFGRIDNFIDNIITVGYSDKN